MTVSSNYNNLPLIKQNERSKLSPTSRQLPENKIEVPLPVLPSPTEKKIDKDLQALKKRIRQKKNDPSQPLNPRKFPNIAKPTVACGSDSDSDLLARRVESESSHTTSSESTPSNNFFGKIADFIFPPLKIPHTPKPEISAEPILIVAMPVQPMTVRWRQGDLWLSTPIERQNHGLSTFQRQKETLRNP